VAIYIIAWIAVPSKFVSGLTVWPRAKTRDGGRRIDEHCPLDLGCAKIRFLGSGSMNADGLTHTTNKFSCRYL